MNDRCLLCGQELRGSPSPEGAAPDATAGEAYDFPSPAVALLPSGPKARRNDPAASHAAAARALPHAGTASWRIMQCLQQHGPLDYAEIAKVTGINPTTASTRLTDLKRAEPPLVVAAIGSDGRGATKVVLSGAGHDLLNASRQVAA